MPNLLKFLCIGLSLSQAFANINPIKHENQQNCNEKSLTQLVAIIDNDNPLCAKWDDQNCLQCASRSYFNDKGICIQVDPLCKQFNYQIKKCNDCYPGYEIRNGSCLIEQAKLSQSFVLGNPLCASWQNKRCTKCSPKSYFNEQKICIMVNPDCKTFSQVNGYCFSCFQGFQLDNNGKCYKIQNDWKLKDPLCAKWGNTGDCIQCAHRSFRNFNGLCEQIDQNCNQFSLQNGECLSCYNGFELKRGKCIQQNQQYLLLNPFCSRWQDRKCLLCAQRTFFNKVGICIKVNPQCRSFSNSNGECTSCYLGYKLTNGQCIVQNKQKNIQANPLCARWLNQKCIKCSNRSYFTSSGICNIIDPSCATYNQRNGQCTSCYKGYDLNNGKCVIGIVGPSQTQIQQNSLCSEWKDKKCIKCSTRSYFNQNGICIQVDPYCKTFSYQKNICLKCYSGYKLRPNLKGCILPQSSSSNYLIQTSTNSQNQGYNDKLCASWLSPTICKNCSTGSYMNNMGKCVEYDPNCVIFNPEVKICQECYDGWEPIEDKCLKFEKGSNFDTQKCLKWNQNKCLQCVKQLKLNQTGIFQCL